MNLHDLVLSNALFSLTLKVQAKQKKIDLTSSKWKTTVLQSILSRKWKDTHRIGEIFANHVSEKRNVFRIYKEFLHLYNKK